MKKILPLADPDVKAYAKHAHIFAILGAQSTQYRPWIYNYYVQLSVPEGTQQFTLDYSIPSIFTYAPNLFVSRIEREVAVDVKGGILSFIKYQIDRGYYIYTYFAVNRIAAYRCERFQVHDPLIFGYDDEKEEIYFADTYQKGHYAIGMATYEEIVVATGTENEWRDWGLTAWTLDVVCMKYKDLGVCFEFDKEMYIRLIEDYLAKRNSYEIHWGVVGWRKGTRIKRVYGIGIYPFLREHILWAKRENRIIDPRGVYVILEHKQILEKTLFYILGENWKKQFPDEGELLDVLIAKATIMLNLCIKYNYTLDGKKVDPILMYSQDIEKIENKLLRKVIQILI